MANGKKKSRWTPAQILERNATFDKVFTPHLDLSGKTPHPKLSPKERGWVTIEIARREMQNVQAKFRAACEIVGKGSETE